MNVLHLLDWGHVLDTLIGVIVGGLIAFAASYFVQRKQAEQSIVLQREQQDHERMQQRNQLQFQRDVELDRYQRDTLAELQDRLEELVTTARALDHERMEMYRKATPEQLDAEEIKTSEYYQEIARRYREARRHVSLLGVRVENEAIRTQLEAIYRLAHRLVDTPPAQWIQLAKSDKFERDPSWEIVDLALDANIAIGKLLRERKVNKSPE